MCRCLHRVESEDRLRFGKVWSLGLHTVAQEGAVQQGETMCVKSLFLIVFAALAPWIALAEDIVGGDAASCDFSAKAAAQKWDVPERIMLAITRVETGRAQEGQILPWPWTINLAGKGYWFDSQAQAIAFAEATQAVGNNNFDVGCFQVNLNWHGNAFDSLAAAFDPDRNADYAAEFLSRLYRESGSWLDAAAAYHSKTPEYAEAYIAKLEPILRDLMAAPAQRAEPVVYRSHRENRFPLLQGGDVSGNGSLMPLLQANGPLIGVSP